MMKLLRKYNKQLLAVFMTLLMVVFIGGSAFENLVRPRYNRLLAESNLGPIRSSDQLWTDQTTNLLGSLGLNWQFPDRSVVEPIGPLEWTLLVREARNLGVSVSAQAVRARMAEEPGVAEIVNAVANQRRMKSEEVYEAVAQLQSIQLAAQAIGEAGNPSVAELRSVAQRVLDKVQVKAVVIPAAAFVLENQDFSPEVVDAHWKKYRDVEPGGGLRFGYFQPLSLRAQYIMIDPEVIATQIRVPDLESKAKRYFKENRETDHRFRKPAPPPSADTEPVPSAFMEYEEAAALAENAVKSEFARDAAERIANWLIRTAQDTLSMATRKANGYREVPAELQAVGAYLELIQRIPKEISFTEAATVGTTDFFQAGTVAATPIIGRATYRPDAGMWKSFATLALRSEPVIPTVPEEPAEDRSDYVAVGETSPYYLTDDAGRLFVFRLVDVKPPHPAESVDEVRDAILRDLRLQDAFLVAKEHGDDLLHQAGELGLEQAYEQNESLKSLKSLKEKPAGAVSGLFSPPPLARINRYDVASGNRTPINAGSGVGSVSAETVAEWFNLEYAVQPRTMQELQERATVLVVEWVETHRATLAEFESIRKQLLAELASARRRELVSRWFDPDNVQARNGVQLKGS